MKAHNDYFLTDRENRNFLNYYWFENGLSEEEIQKIDDQIRKQLKDTNTTLNDGVIFSEKDDLETIHKVRKSKIAWIQEGDEWQWLYDKFIDMTDIANKKMWNLELVGMTEKIQYSHYEGDGSHYSWHMDIGQGHAVRRKISIAVQLSDPKDYEGGDFEFMLRADKTVVPRNKGAVVLFPSFMLHKVTPVTKGLRKSLVAWVSGPCWK
jgi:PKHD-type hydroxylase